ncbi:LysR family transcriptional regulator [Marinilactibacillus psychrotolerans]|uniref:LysR family transcriptional regulator n=1 Tax=Marinilactibacillus psychrotolerans TaxID=191770 RepID=UPI0039AF5C4F
MLDYRLNTFLKLCDTMNYHRTAELLHMTQPAVTQHIHYLENKYQTKFFMYDGRNLKKTEEAREFESYARSAQYNESIFLKKVSNKKMITLRIGATKTIGEYVITDQVSKILDSQNYTLSLSISNTEHLLFLINQNKLDFAIIEGFFSKKDYDYKFYKNESFVGVCSKTHPFANKNVSFEDIFKETLIVREEGSGTREIFEQILNQKNYTLDNFKKIVCISSFKLIKEIVLSKDIITFAYESIPNSDENLSYFTIEDNDYIREFNYVYLKNANARNYISVFEG